MVLASAQYKIAESDFINGKIDAADLSARKSVESDAIVNYAQTKASLNMYLLQLEVLSNTKIINNALKWIHYYLYFVSYIPFAIG